MNGATSSSLKKSSDNYEALKRAGARRRHRQQRLRAAPSASDELFYRPDLYVERLLPGLDLTWYQAEILAMLGENRRASARGPHGLGKTALASAAVLWFAETRQARGLDWKVVTTAGSHRQLTHFLWPEIKKWANYRSEVFIRKEVLLERTIKMPNGEAFAASVTDPSLIEGAHAEQLLYVFDEAKAINADIFDAVEGAFSSAGPDTDADAFALAISTPGETSGRFYDIQRRMPGTEDWAVRHVTVDEAIEAGRISAQWVEDRARMWGRKSQVFINRVEGNFAQSSERSVIPLTWVERANERWLEEQEKGFDQQGERRLGVDVARGGGDKTVMAKRIGNAITEIHDFNYADTMETVGEVKRVGAGGFEPWVDVVGVGAGVYDRLRETGSAFAFNSAEKSELTDKSGELGFANKRSAAWWRLRELLDPDSNSTIMLPPNDVLTGDLTAPEYTIGSNGKIQIEPKDKIQRRIGRSTDFGDAVVYAFALKEIKPPPVEYAGSWNEGDLEPIDWT